jgi:hypothetical protein
VAGETLPDLHDEQEQEEEIGEEKQREPAALILGPRANLVASHTRRQPSSRRGDEDTMPPTPNVGGGERKRGEPEA